MIERFVDRNRKKNALIENQSINQNEQIKTLIQTFAHSHSLCLQNAQRIHFLNY